MKRAFFEWGAIATYFLALACFAYWVVSLSTPLANFEIYFPLGRWKSTEVVGVRGTITINDHYGSQREIETVAKYRIISPPPASQTRWVLPGFLYQSINWGNRLVWSLQFSLLIPAVLLTLVAAFFTYGYLRVRRQALAAFRNKTRSGSPFASAAS